MNMVRVQSLLISNASAIPTKRKIPEAEETCLYKYPQGPQQSNLCVVSNVRRQANKKCLDNG